VECEPSKLSCFACQKAKQKCSFSHRAPRGFQKEQRKRSKGKGRSYPQVTSAYESDPIDEDWPEDDELLDEEAMAVENAIELDANDPDSFSLSADEALSDRCELPEADASANTARFQCGMLEKIVKSLIQLTNDVTLIHDQLAVTIPSTPLQSKVPHGRKRARSLPKHSGTRLRKIGRKGDPSAARGSLNRGKRAFRGQGKGRRESEEGWWKSK
jgi:hypothetical protein